jgi:hypothetical protein
VSIGGGEGGKLSPSKGVCTEEGSLGGFNAEDGIDVEKFLNPNPA